MLEHYFPSIKNDYSRLNKDACLEEPAVLCEECTICVYGVWPLCVHTCCERVCSTCR